MLSAIDALERLHEGNRRFVSGVRSLETLTSQTRRSEFISGQKPFAVILGCSDSRVPVELVFDQGLGDLFVIRVAGNVVAPSQIGSVEFAAAQFGTQLVVVLGHTRCSAVQSTVDELLQPGENQSSRPTRCATARRFSKS
jgi:carbonic anhydrase